MIVSHAHRFVFVKNPKTAGSSVEVALSAVCGADDVVTVLTPPEPGHHPRNVTAFRSSLADLPPTDGDNWLTSALGTRPSTWPDGAMPHLPAHVVARSHPQMWSEYFTFVVERNPWDKLVSAYHREVATGQELEFASWLPLGISLYAGSHIYRDVDGEVIVDRILRYEDLDTEIRQVFAHLGLPFDGLPRSKAGFRPTDTYREYYTDELRAAVATGCAWEIAHLGYEF